jgi:predicted CoA-binding protein
MDNISDLLETAQTIAVVGLSDNPDRSSYGVAEYLQGIGYRIIPVNPAITEWKGIPVVASLKEIDMPVDIVDIFRRPEHVPPHVDEAIEIGARAVWMQQGIRNEEAAQKAEAAGLMVVQDRCIALEHSKRRREIGDEGAW